MRSSLYRDAALADSSRPMPREGGGSSRTILATVIGIIPTEMPVQEEQPPPPVEMNGARHRPTHKDRFGTVRPLEATPAVEPLLIQPPAQNNEIASHEMDTRAAPPRLTYMDSVGRIRPLAVVVESVPPTDPPTQDNESAPDATYTGAARRPAYKDSFGSVRFADTATVAAVRPYVPPAQNNESDPDAKYTGAAHRPAYKDSFGSVRFAETVTVAAMRPYVPPTQSNESAPDATYNGTARRPAYKDSFGSVRLSETATVAAVRHPAYKDSFVSVATVAAVRPYAQNPAYKDSFCSVRLSETATVAAVRPYAQNNETASDKDEAVRIRRSTYVDRADTHPSTAASMPRRVPLAQDNASTLDEREAGAGSRPVHKDCFDSVRLAVAVIPPIADLPQLMKPKKVDEACDIFYDDIKFNEGDVRSNKKKAHAFVIKLKEVDETGTTSYDEMTMKWR
jgi:hypothetical protein